MPTVSKIIARIDIPFANNVVEAFHKKFKNEFLQGTSFASHIELSAALPFLIDKYNNQYHDRLSGYSPLEVWNGAIPDTQRFREAFRAAGENRKNINKTFSCCAVHQNTNVLIVERFTVVCP